MTVSTQSSGLRTHRLPWSEPCLPQAAAWLLDRAARHSLAGLCELDGVVCVLPGRRAGRLLLHHLIELAGSRREHLAPPRIVTPGNLASLFRAPEQALASPIERSLAWVAALQRLPSDSQKRLLPSPPGEGQLPAWLDLARPLVALEDELKGGCVAWSAAREQAEKLELLAEADRWTTLEEAASIARLELARIQLAIPGDEAAASTASIQADRIVLIGIVDLNAMQRRLLAAAGCAVDALVHASSDLPEAAFDEFGCVREPFWSLKRLPIEEEKIILVDRPEDQAQAVLHELASTGGRFSAAEIVVGLGDESLAGTIQRSGEFAGLAFRAAEGRPWQTSGPARLLTAIGELLREDRFEHFASLVRHPDIDAWLQRSFADQPPDPGVGSWLTVLDRYFSDSLAPRLTEPWLGKRENADAMKAVHDRVRQLLSPLHAPDRALGQWTSPLIEVLGLIYDKADDDITNQSLALLRESLAALESIHPAIQPGCSAAAAIGILLSQAAGESLPQGVRADQIEMLGWLELHLDSSPCLILTGVNDGSIPATVMSDPFLTDSLRGRLGLTTNNRRFARDMYLLHAILASRAHVSLITGRRADDGEPLPPSRLLLACDDAVLPSRIAHLCDERAALSWELPAGLPPVAADTKFTVPSAPPAPASLTSLRVTQFRDYIACPYRFALRHVIRLEAVADIDVELNPLSFGSLAHDVLCAFGSDEAIRDSFDPAKISDFLRDNLHQLARERFGPRPRTAISVQIARLEQRFRGLAEHQAQLVQQGWRIKECEWKFDDSNLLEIPGELPVQVRGRIDRIDWNEKLKTWRILDYKAGDKPDSPFKKHHGSERDTSTWEDLQLPLYRHLAAQRDITGQVELGYFLLPRDPRDAKVVIAKWTDDDIARAIVQAQSIVSKIRRGEFEINLDFKSDFDEFARICQTQVLREDTNDAEDAT